MLLKEIKALKTIAGQDRFGNPIAGKDLYDERRVYIIDGNMETIESFMSMEAATRAIKNNPKKFPKGVKVMSGKELNKHFHSVSEDKKDIPRDYYGKPLRGVKKELALRSRKEYLDDIRNGKDRTAFDDIKNDFIGVARRVKVKEETLETIDAEELWDQNSGDSSTYVSNATYLVRPIKGSSPTQYEAFLVVGDKRTPFGKFNAVELKQTLKPIRANQTPDAEGFITYTDPTKVDAFKYSGEPVKVKIGVDTSQISKGDYLVRTVKGDNFEYHVEDGGDFESTLKKA